MPTTEIVTSNGVALRCHDVSRTYRSPGGQAPVEALRDINLTLEPGTITVLIGPSGCGKSTLLRLIGGLDHPTSGSITIGDVAADVARREKRFGFVPQAPTLLSWRTVRENVRLLTEVNRQGSSPAKTTTDAAVDETKSNDLYGQVLDQINADAVNDWYRGGAPVVWA